MKASDLTIGRKIKYDFYGKHGTNSFWTVMSIDLQDKRFCYIRSDKNGKLRRIPINRLQPLKNG